MRPRERLLLAIAAVLAIAAPGASDTLRGALEEEPGWYETGATEWERHRVLDQDTVRVWYIGGVCEESVDWDVYYGRRYVAINVFARQAPGVCVDLGKGKSVDVELEIEDLGDRDVIPGPLRIDP